MATRLAEVKAERDQARAELSRYQLALSDLVYEKHIAHVETFTVDGIRYTIRFLNRAEPLILVTGKVTDGGWIYPEVAPLETYYRDVREKWNLNDRRTAFYAALDRGHLALQKR